MHAALPIHAAVLMNDHHSGMKTSCEAGETLAKRKAGINIPHLERGTST
jgi:hypothetical protein